MKYIVSIIFLTLLIGCKEERVPKDYAVIHGKISNLQPDNALRLYNPETSKSMILEVDENGNFRDTLHLEKPAYFNVVYNNVFPLYLANDMDVEMNFDADKMVESLTFSGRGAAENEFLRYKNRKTMELLGDDYQKYLGLEQAEFDKKTSAYNEDLMKELDSKKDVYNPAFVTSEKESFKQFEDAMQAQHLEQLEINEKLGEGTPSPEFKDYLAYSGGTKSLSDFKGKYLYIDVWATWCVPCIAEMPHLIELEKEYANRNIQFLGISIDRKKDEAKWRKMIAEKGLGGAQLLADDEINSQFIQDYYIQGIPRFIILDPQGNIVDYDAPRPSDPALREKLESLNI